VGSPAYMAPEQVEAEPVSPATDLWALGATLWFAVEGQPPFGGGEFQTLSAIVNGQPRRPQRLGVLAPVLARLLVKDPTRRATPSQLRPLLRQVASGQGRDGGQVHGVPAADAATRTAADHWAGATVVVGGRGAPTAPGPAGEPGAGPAGPGGAPPAGGDRGGVESGDTPPVPSRVRRREGDGDTAVRAPKKGRRRGRRLPPVPPVPMSGEPVYAGARRPRARLPVVFAAVAVVLAGTFVWQSLTRDDQERRPTAETRRPAVPASWRSFQDPDGTYRLSFPPTWTPTDRGPFIDFTEPGGERFFRVQPTTDGLAPLVAQQNLERAFMARHPGDGYRRLRLGSTTFRSVPAAEWEFTFLDEGRPTRGYDITFVAAGRRHAILFQAPANRWAGSRDELQSFLAGFRPRG
jgi:eukaryotic-like serine/threonine-protein kinase